MGVTETTQLMRAHLVQLDIVWEDHAANFARVDRLLTHASVGEGDLVLLPEMFSTGFSLNTDLTADRQGVVLEYLRGLATDLGAWVQGGRTVRDCDCTHATNEAPVFDPSGRLVCSYTKIHPFSFGREPEKFVGGSDVLTFRWVGGTTGGGAGREREGLSVCPAICYDLRFPELFRRGLDLGAECFTLGACWPRARQAHWRALLVARAIENQAFVLGVNRTGRDPTLEYAGGSIAIGPAGEVLGELGSDESVLSVDLDVAALHAWRAKFPAWKDRKLGLGSRAPEPTPDTSRTSGPSPRP